MSLSLPADRFAQQLRHLQVCFDQLLQEGEAGRLPAGLVSAALDELNTALAELDAAEAERLYYQELFQSAPDAYVVTDGRGLISAANHAAAGLLNVPADRLPGLALPRFFTTEGRRRLRQRLQKLSAAAVPLTWEDQVQPRHRPALEVAITALPKAEPGQPLELRWRLDNITDRRQSERALRDSEERYHRLVHASLEAIYLYDAATWRVLEANPAFLRMLGYTAAEVQGLTVFDISANDRASIERFWRQVMAGGPVDLGERLWRRKDGRPFDVQVTASKIRQGERDIIAIIGRDISAHKAAEARLRESEARFRRLAENAPDIIYRFRLRPNRGYEYISPAVTTLLGFTPEEFYANPELGRQQTHPDDREVLNAIVDNRARIGQLIKLRRIHKDGRIVWTEQRPVVLYDEAGQPVAVEGIIRDITEQTQSFLENARLFEAEREQRALAEALRHTAELLNSSLEFEQVLDQILLHAESLVNYDLALITLLDPDDRLRTAHSRGHEKFGQPAYAGQIEYALSDFPLLSQTAAIGQPLTIPDTATHPGWVVVPETAWVRSHVVAPLRMKGQVTGFISLNSQVPNFYGAAHAPRLQAFADQAAMALENAMLFEQLRSGRQQLQALSQRLLEVQETERRVLARELHDEIGQALTGLQLFLEAGSRSQREPAHAKLETAQAMMNDLINRVRDLSLDLRPTMLDDLGLLPALLWQFERYTAQTAIRVNFQHFGLDRRFDPDLETAAYRIVQEALTNVARYARVDVVTVNLWADAATLNVQVEDQGAGFNPEHVRATHRSNGLAGMRERATLLHGQLTVEAAPGAGTQITAELPVRHTPRGPAPVPPRT